MYSLGFSRSEITAPRNPQPDVTSDLAPAPELLHHYRGRDGSVNPCRRARKFFVMPILDLSPLGSGFCEEILANSMIPIAARGRGLSRLLRLPNQNRETTQPTGVPIEAHEEYLEVKSTAQSQPHKPTSQS